MGARSPSSQKRRRESKPPETLGSEAFAEDLASSTPAATEIGAANPAIPGSLGSDLGSAPPPAEVLGPSDAELERGILDAVRMGLADVARTLAAQLHDRRMARVTGPRIAGMDTGDPGPQLTHGYWLVAFVDLLGQQEAFCKTDYLPNAEDPARRAAFEDEVRASLGVVRTMRSLLDTFRAALANTAIEPGDPLYGLNSEALARIGAMKRRRVREYRWSDGVMLACPLKPEPDHAVPILAVYCRHRSPRVPFPSGSPVPGPCLTVTQVSRSGLWESQLLADRLPHRRPKTGFGLLDRWSDGGVHGMRSCMVRRWPDRWLPLSTGGSLASANPQASTRRPF
jgi:hypothetical protein